MLSTVDSAAQTFCAYVIVRGMPLEIVFVYDKNDEAVIANVARRNDGHSVMLSAREWLQVATHLLECE